MGRNGDGKASNSKEGLGEGTANRNLNLLLFIFTFLISKKDLSIGANMMTQQADVPPVVLASHVGAAQIPAVAPLVQLPADDLARGGKP